MINYDNLPLRFSKQVKARFNEIEAIHNFDYGIETEIALCEILAEILPDKYGVCRGFVISGEGNRVGDDVIIYDKMNFPTVRKNSKISFVLKQQVPAEAVYAYIECKNAILDQEVLDKAIKQTKDIKNLLYHRRSEKNPLYDKDGPVYGGVNRDWPRQEPMLKNQPFTMVFTRNWDTSLSIDQEISLLTPDILVLGEHWLATQKINLGPDGIKGAIFFDHQFPAPLLVEKVEGKAFGISLIMLMQALESITLLPINWYNILNEEFKQ